MPSTSRILLVLANIINRTMLIICIVLMLFGVFLPVSYAAPTATKPVPTAQPVQRVARPRAPTDIRKVAVGPAYMLGLLQNNTLVAWGDNRHWQSTIPYRDKDTQFTDVAAGLNVAYALDTTGAVVAWGEENAYNENAVPVDAQSNVTAISAGGRFCIALMSAGTVIG
jgi:alpha-tubulin suppressor-like RCC1 family protein